jgi:riboflavin biosynthesis pyrimidine reductase
VPGRRHAAFVLRLPDDDLTETLDKIVIDRSSQLAHDAKAIKRMSESVPVIVAVNNHFAGYAPETIRELMEALK